MKKQTAWNGFYKAIKTIKECEAIAKKQGHACNIATKWEVAKMNAFKYARSLVVEHGWQDVHTKKYIEVR